MGLRGPHEGELRLALSEMIRQDRLLPREERQDVRTVTGWWDSTFVRYQGTSSEHPYRTITVSYETWSGEEKHYLVEGTYDEMLNNLAALVDLYGTES